MWLSGITAIIHSNGDSAYLWNITLWIFASAKLLPPPINSTLLVFMVFSIQLMTSADIFFIFWGGLLSSGTISYNFLYSIQAIARYFSVWSCPCWGCIDLCRVVLLWLWILCCIRSVPYGTIWRLLASCKSFAVFVLLIFSSSSVGWLWVCICLGRFFFKFFWINVFFSFLLEFFILVLADGFSLEFYWEQIFSCLQDTFLVFWPISAML